MKSKKQVKKEKEVKKKEGVKKRKDLKTRKEVQKYEVMEEEVTEEEEDTHIPGRFKKTIQHVPPEEIARRMISLSRNESDWNTFARSPGTLWWKLGSTFNKDPTQNLLKNLKDRFSKNGRKVYTAYVHLLKMKTLDMESKGFNITCFTCKKTMPEEIMKTKVNLGTKCVPTYMCPDCKRKTVLSFPSLTSVSKNEDKIGFQAAEALLKKRQEDAVVPIKKAVELRGKKKPRKFPNVPVAKQQHLLDYFDDVFFVRWGDGAKDFTVNHFTNTCTMDNCFYLLIYAYKKITSFKIYVDNSADLRLKTLVNHLVEENTNQARCFWVFEVLNRKKARRVNMVGDEQEVMLLKLGEMFPELTVTKSCMNHHCQPLETMACFGYIGRTVEEIVELINTGGDVKNCDTCKVELKQTVSFNQPPLPLIGFGVTCIRSIESIPRVVIILGVRYKLLACTLLNLKPNQLCGHYKMVIFKDMDVFTYDGTDVYGSIVLGGPVYSGVSIVFYTLM